MIRINLLPVKRRKRPRPLPGYVVGTVLLTVIVGIGVFFINTTLAEKIKELRDTKARNEQRLKTLKGQLKQLKDYERLVKEVEDKKKIIVDLRRNQAGPVKILLFLNDALPRGVWFKNLTIRGDEVNLQGLAFSNDDIVKYVNNLKAQGVFSSIYLIETRRGGYKVEGIQKDITIYSFRISLIFKGG